MLHCSITLDRRVAENIQLMVTDRWTGPHGKLENEELENGELNDDPRITVVKEQDSSDQYSSTVTFNTVHVGDSGSYSCEANVSHRLSQFIHQGMNTSVTTIAVQGNSWLCNYLFLIYIATCVFALPNSSKCGSVSDRQHHSSSQRGTLQHLLPHLHCHCTRGCGLTKDLYVVETEC